MADSEMMMRPMGGLSPYESFKISDRASRKSNGGTITALVLGSVGLFAGIGAWIFGPVVSSSRAKGLRDLANARYDATNQQLALLTNLLASERNERGNEHKAPYWTEDQARTVYDGVRSSIPSDYTFCDFFVALNMVKSDN